MAKLDNNINNNLMSGPGNPGKLGGSAIGLKDTEEITCSACGCKIFDQAILLRKVSAMITGTGQPGLIPIPVFCCHECGTPVEELYPQELK